MLLKAVGKVGKHSAKVVQSDLTREVIYKRFAVSFHLNPDLLVWEEEVWEVVVADLVFEALRFVLPLNAKGVKEHCPSSLKAAPE